MIFIERPSREPTVLPEWVRRAMFIHYEPDGCTCTFEDVDAYEGHCGHPTPGCPLRTDCGGYTSNPPCGGCDRCIEDQIAYAARKAGTL